MRYIPPVWTRGCWKPSTKISDWRINNSYIVLCFGCLKYLDPRNHRGLFEAHLMWDVDKQSDSVLTKATFVFLELPVPMLLCVVRSVGSTIETFLSIVVQRTSYLHSWNLMKSHLTTDNMISVERPPNGGNERHAPGLSIKETDMKHSHPSWQAKAKVLFLAAFLWIQLNLEFERKTSIFWIFWIL